MNGQTMLSHYETTTSIVALRRHESLNLPGFRIGFALKRLIIEIE